MPGGGSGAADAGRAAPGRAGQPIVPRETGNSPAGGVGLGSGGGRVSYGAASNQPSETVTVAVVIRMKRMGRKNRAYYRICATDRRSPRDGRVIEAIGTYDPSVPDTDARCTFDAERVRHWLSVGAQPSDAVRVLWKKYGPDGTRLKEMEQARARLSMPRIVPEAGEPVFVPEPKSAPAAAAPAAAPAVEAASAEAPAETPAVADAAGTATEAAPE